MSVLNIALYVVFALMGLGLLVMVASGVRSLMFGKVKLLSVGIAAVPLLLFVVLGLALPTWTDAGIMTIILSLGLTLVALLVSGIKNIIS
ncbi:MAG: hypothetical protein OXH03_04915 [Bacteroidetes bacterium]|nr:hypothetical protein [Bacteroidota bacterium]MXW82031.1 hypothetical protein [Rhodothermaceae bacterium]MDE2672879.1 hypothetical protein [Bacteroidota bacterium]MXX58479.1 hypothetical protein [Rhodothermaceae bacterium]MYD19208.1 hypothetical protein [Rhodothermaceae bacterium]